MQILIKNKSSKIYPTGYRNIFMSTYCCSIYNFMIQQCKKALYKYLYIRVVYFLDAQHKH